MLWQAFGRWGAIGGAASSLTVVANTLTIASGEVSSDISNFPVYLDMSDLGSTFWSTVASDGSNIRIRKSGVDVPFDLIYFNYAGQTGDLHFKSDLAAASDNIFTIELVPGASAPAVTDPLGRNAVWSWAQRVVHGRENAERTGSGSTLTLGGNAAFSGGAMTFDGTDDYIYLSAGSPQTSYSLFVYATTGETAPRNYVPLSFADSWSASPNRQTIAIRSLSDNLSVWNNTNGWIDGPVITTPGDFSAGVTSVSGGNRILYVDGSNVASNGSAANIPNGGSPILAIGAEDSSLSEEFGGSVYLAILAPSILSGAWFAAMNTNLRTPTSFYSIT